MREIQEKIHYADFVHEQHKKANKEFESKVEEIKSNLKVMLNVLFPLLCEVRRLIASDPKRTKYPLGVVHNKSKNKSNAPLLFRSPWKGKCQPAILQTLETLVMTE